MAVEEHSHQVENEQYATSHSALSLCIASPFNASRSREMFPVRRPESPLVGQLTVDVFITPFCLSF